MALNSFASLLALLSLITSISAQAQVAIISNTLPACAQTCAILLQSQTACVPPPLGAAAVSNQQTYNSCFCNAVKVAAPPNAICPVCSPADMGTTQQWLGGVCNAQNGAAPNGPTTTTASSTTLATSTTATSKTPAAKATGARTAGGVTQDTSDGNKSWISTHYRWVIMIIILFLGLGALAIGGTMLHRRYQRRQELGGHDRTGQPDLGSWGPGQSVHEIGPPGAAGATGATDGVVSNEKGKGRAEVQEQGAGDKRGGNRLKKGLLSRF